MKKVFIFFLFCLTIAFAPIVLAQTVSPAQTLRGENQTARLSALHTTCDNAISQRLTNLNDALTRVNGLAKLSADEKSQYSSQIQSDINGLTSLKSKCDADTDLTTLRDDIKSIYTNFRVYAEFLPVTRLLIAADTMTTTAGKLNDLYTKLVSRVSSAGNPSNLTALLSDMQSKINDANTQYNNVESQLTGLTPTSFDSNPSGTKSTIQTARSEIQTGSSDLKTALSDAKQIIQALGGGGSTATSPTTTQ